MEIILAIGGKKTENPDPEIFETVSKVRSSKKQDNREVLKRIKDNYRKRK